jgi:hypothetical protein
LSFGFEVLNGSFTAANSVLYGIHPTPRRTRPRAATERSAGPRSSSTSPSQRRSICNAALDPDWLRVGADIVGGATPPTLPPPFL